MKEWGVYPVLYKCIDLLFFPENTRVWFVPTQSFLNAKLKAFRSVKTMGKKVKKEKKWEGNFEIFPFISCLKKSVQFPKLKLIGDENEAEKKIQISSTFDVIK